MTVACSTRACLLTPPGAGAIGVVRLAGTRAEEIALEFFQPRRGHRGPVAPGRLRFGSFLVHGEPVDDVVVSASVIQGETVIDFCAHGGIRIMECLLQAFAARGVDIATDAGRSLCPWPVTNLIEYEAASALATARTSRAVKFLARQFGALPNRIRELAASCRSDARHTADLATSLLRHYEDTRHLVHGATVSLIGPTNAGKSTLFNRLVGRHATVVSATAGTTRDWACEPIELGGVGVDLIDTAGAGGCGDELEQAAVNVGQRRAGEADLRLIVLDASNQLEERWMEALDGWLALGPALLVRTKTDRPAAWSPTAIQRAEAVVCSISAQSGAGLSELGAAIEQVISPGPEGDGSISVFTPRQAAVLQRARAALAEHPSESARLLRQELLGPEPATRGAEA